MLRQRRQGRVDPAQLPAAGYRIRLHAQRTADEVAGLELRIPGRDHFADRAGAHHLADLHWADIGLAGIHPAAHRRVERDVLHLDQHFTVLRFGHGRLLIAPVAALGQADRARGQLELLVDQTGHGGSSIRKPASSHKPRRPKRHPRQAQAALYKRRRHAEHAMSHLSRGSA
jgi:hypothetical protein